MISVLELNHMSNSALISIYKSLNHWEWTLLLGEKPAGWDEMPNYKKSTMGKCQTKDAIIRPYMKAINKRISHEQVYPKASLFSD